MAESIEITLQTDECDLLREFLQESRERLADIEDLVLRMEGMGQEESPLVQDVFRMIHTIKGTAGFFGLSFLERMSHRVENLLDAIRKGDLSVDADVTDCLLAGMDRLRRIIDAAFSAAHAPVRRQNGVLLLVEPIETGDVCEWIEAEMAKAGARSVAGDVAPAPPVAVALASVPVADQEQGCKYTFPEDLQREFQEEVREHLSSLESSLLAAEKRQDAAGDEVNAAMRSFHTIKGTAGLLLSCIEDEGAREGHVLGKVHALTHAAESLLQRRRNKGEAPVRSDIALLLRVHDALGGLIGFFVQGGHVGGPDVAVLLKDCATAASSPVVALPADVAGVLSTTVEILTAGLSRIRGAGQCRDTLARMQAAGQELHRGAAGSGMEELGEQAGELLNVLEFLGSDWNPEVEKFCFPELDRVIACFRATLAELATTAKAKSEAKPSPPIREAGQEAAPEARPEVADEARPAESLTTVIKVPQHRLDQLMNLVGELVVNRNALAHLTKGSDPEARLPGVAERLKAVSGSFAHIIDELQATVLAIRMMPVGHAFAKMPRMVRDLARKLEKDIRLEMEGADIEVDKNVVEALGEPLVHLVRNCVDHGLEAPGERKRAGKPEECVIRLRARHDGKHVLVEVSDDGRGIDAEKIRRKVLDRGLADSETLAGMSEDEVRGFIFLPGFSTATAVTVVSGRGVGMDVVRRRIDSVGGKVDLVSVPGRGTTITMTLPLTLSVHRGLEVACGQEHYYIPIEYVVESVRVPRAAVHSHRGGDMVEVRGRTLRMVDLGGLMEVKRGGDTEENSWYSLVILDLGERMLALRVDRFFREGEFVLKNLPAALTGLPLIQGTMIMPDGRLILVLDPGHLLGELELGSVKSES